jgi:lysophospholipase L1-like esterase
MSIFLCLAVMATGCAGAATASDPGAAASSADRSTDAPADSSAATTRPSTPAATDRPIDYVALGDSYTIGTSVRNDARWPNQLVRATRPQVRLRLVENLGLNGATSADVISQQLPELDGLGPDLVSILIGVNDVFGGIPAETYRHNVRQILDDLTSRLPADRVLVVSTPDYTLTSAGSGYPDPEGQSARITEANDILRTEAELRGLTFVDITPVANEVPDDPSLVARDGLHASAKQYAGWVELIAPALREMLKSGDAP